VRFSSSSGCSSGSGSTRLQPFARFSTFGLAYATHYASIDNASALNALIVAAGLTTVTIPLAGALSDRLGRKPLYVAGTLAIMVFAFPYFLLVSLRSALWFGVATSVALAICWAPVTAVLGTVYSEIFSTDVRYTGVTLGYQVGSAVAGGTAPFISTSLLAIFSHSWLPVAAYLVLASGVSLYTISKTRETRHVDLRTVTLGRETPGMKAPS
jgi:MFS family permease